MEFTTKCWNERYFQMPLKEILNQNFWCYNKLVSAISTAAQNKDTVNVLKQINVLNKTETVKNSNNLCFRTGSHMQMREMHLLSKEI